MDSDPEGQFIMDLDPDPTWIFLWPLEKNRVSCKIRTVPVVKRSLKMIQY
jgi:hypothetical protein